MTSLRISALLTSTIAMQLSVFPANASIRSRVQSLKPTPIDKQAQTVTDTTPPPCLSWINPTGKPRFAMLCIHGLGLYSGSYKDFARRMNKHGAAVYAIDVRGFGNWAKAQGHEEVDFDACINDIKVTLQAIRKNHPGTPLYLLGESMGGAIALRAAATYPGLMDGLISSVPAGERFQQKRTDLKVALGILAHGARKDLNNIGSQVVKQASTADLTDPETGKKEKVVNEQLLHDWEDDPLDRMDLSAKELVQFQAFMNDNHDIVKKITTLPVLFVQGIDDQLVRPDGTWDLFKELSTNDRTLLALPSRHLIFEHGQTENPDLKQTALHMVLSWIIAEMTDANAGQAGQPANDSTAASTGSESNAAQTPGSDAINDVIESLAQNDFSRALQLAQTAVADNPNSSHAHYWLALALAKTNAPVKARAELQTAMRLGRGRSIGRKANEFMLSNLAYPPAGGNQANRCKLTPPALHAITGGKPTVIAFFAPWIEQCAQLDALMKQGQAQFPNRVSWRTIDVSDSSNDDIVQAFDIGPVPTLVFLKPDGTISSTIIGQSSFVAIAKGIAQMMR